VSRSACLAGSNARQVSREHQVGMSDIDLAAYFARVGFSAAPTPSLETLQVLHRLHPAAITFENLDPLLQRPVHLQLDLLMRKLVAQRRGGYCYEQNTLFAAMLRRLGYRIVTLAARVQWGAPEGVIRSRSHMLLRIDLPQASYIADVGFGLLTLTAPLQLRPDLEQSTPLGLHRLVSIGDEFQLQVKLTDNWAAIYQFSLQEQLSVDWEVQNWFTSTHPESTFTNSLMVARPLGDLRYALLNDRLSVHYADGRVERRTLSGVPELKSALHEVFDLSLPADVDQLLRRFTVE
jgi:N-hydroxyarylamine O-acetyltransferase